MSVSARGMCLGNGVTAGRNLRLQGKAVPRAALASRPLCAGARRARPPAARFAAPSRSARGPRRHERASWQRENNVLDHQGDEADQVTRGRSRTDARRWAEGEGAHHPSPSGQRWVSPGTCQERFASLRDGLRPHLTEPVRRLVSLLRLRESGRARFTSSLHGLNREDYFL